MRGLFDLGMKRMALTAMKQREKASNFKTFGERNVVIGGLSVSWQTGDSMSIRKEERFSVPVLEQTVSCV
jgi:hypothetical protein